jgi:hypothetical protein
MATTPNPASFRNLPNTLNQLTEQYEREELDVERANSTPTPGLSDADRAAEAIQAFDPKTTMLKGESIDVALGALGFIAPEIAALPIGDIARSVDSLTSDVEGHIAPRSYDDLSPEEQRESDQMEREEFEAQRMSGPGEPNDDDGTYPSDPEIVELSVAELPRYQITGQLEDDAHGEDRAMIATGLGPNLWSVTGMEPYSYKGDLPLIAEVAGATLEEALRDTTLSEGFVVTPLNDAAKVERGEIHDNVLQVATSHDKADDPFARVKPGVNTDILLSNLLRETHHALSGGAKEEHLTEQLTTFLKNAESQHPALLTTASDFLTSGISKPSDVVDALMMQAKENTLRDTDPPRTLQQHLREVLKEGDDPANTLQVINQWHNPTNDAAKAEEIRATIAQEWARSLATEGQPPLAIRDSLTLHLPDSDVPGQSHVAVSVRVHEEVNHPHLPQRDAEHLAQRSPEVESNRRENAGPRQTEQRLDRTPIEVPGRVSSITSAERNPESPRR